jgi:3-hydroxyacyl-CoA dehydrogenase
VQRELRFALQTRKEDHTWLRHDGLGDPKYQPCPLRREKVEARELGRKTGRGFFGYG